MVLPQNTQIPKQPKTKMFEQNLNFSVFVKDPVSEIRTTRNIKF